MAEPEGLGPVVERKRACSKLIISSYHRGRRQGQTRERRWKELIKSSI